MCWFKKSAKEEQPQSKLLIRMKESFNRLEDECLRRNQNRVDTEELMSVLTTYNIVVHKGKSPKTTHRLVMPSGVKLKLNIIQDYNTKQTILVNIYLHFKTASSNITPFPMITSTNFKGKLVDFLESILAQDAVYYERSQYVRI